MPSILFLADPDGPPSNNNIETLPAAFEAAGWLTVLGTHSLSWLDGAVYAGREQLTDFDLVWPIGLGKRHDFIDRMQLLAHSGARCINPPSAYLLLHGKLMWADLMPLTFASANPEELVPHLPRRERWILKPAAGSFGRGVLRLASTDTNQLFSTMRRSPGEWFLLQQENPDISRGEHRTLVAGGEIVGSYRREPGARGIANLAAGGIASAGQPQGREAEVVELVRARLDGQSVGFAAIDTSGDHLVEVNVANPGGLGTLRQVWQADFGARLVDSVSRWSSLPTNKN